MLPYSWEVLALKNGRVVFALDANGYEALSKNIAELQRWVKEAQWRLQYYRGEHRKELPQ